MLNIHLVKMFTVNLQHIKVSSLYENRMVLFIHQV